MKHRPLIRELFVRPLLEQRRRLYGIAVSLLVLALSQALFLLMVKGFIKALFQGRGVATVPLIDLLPPKSATWFPVLTNLTLTTDSLAIIVPIIILIAGWSKSLASYLYQLNQQALALYLAKSYREKLFRALISLPYTDIVKRPVGVWMSLIMNDVMLLQSRFTDIMTSLIRDSVAVIACFSVLTVVHWPSALVLFLMSPIIAFGMGRTGKRIAHFAEIYQRELGRIAACVLDMRARFDFIRAQQGEAFERSRFAELNQNYYSMIRQSILIRSAFAPMLEFFGFGVFALAVYAIGNGLWGDFPPALMLQFFVALGLLLRPLREMGEQLSRYHETRGTLLNSLGVFELLAKKAQASEAQKMLPISQQDLSSRGINIRQIRAGMAEEVRFSASNLCIIPGKAVAIIGPSGAGKSTLLKTLAGLVAPIAWDGDFDWRHTIDLVSMVSQEPFLFDDTIEANLLYGLEADARPPMAQLWTALATVNIADEVKSWPEGLNTRLRAIGSNVSGGQLQRLVIARGLLRRKPIWLLDEATAAIDAKSERDITLRLTAACRETGHALLAVTHRLTWLSAFDEVWFVEKGELALAGAHKDLLKDPRYRSYCDSAGGVH